MTSEGAPAAGKWRSVVPAQDEQTTFETSVAHVARVYDYWLGGKDNFAVDRAAGEQAIAAYPDIVHSVRANRAFLARTTDWKWSSLGWCVFRNGGPAPRSRRSARRPCGAA